MSKKKTVMGAILDTKEYYKSALDAETEEHDATRDKLTAAEKLIVDNEIVLQSANTDAENLLAYSKDLELKIKALKEK